ncbi:MAG: hypothetical protein ACYTAS_10050 [Planctomycetota bacterium]|jgi:hypothetical protein
MAQAQACNRCSQVHDCKKIYQQLGQAEGPSVALRVLIAFGLPIVVFVTALAAFEPLLRSRLAERYQTPVALVLALAVTTASMLGVSIVFNRLHKER